LTPDAASGGTDQQEPALNREALQPFQLEAIEEYFDGDRSFYTVFLNSCIDQFAQDLAEADTACAQGDAATLRRVAHSLKSVLRTLGFAADSALAKQVEEAAQHRPLADAQTQWLALRERLVHTFELDV
jgi:HPt (histidine-containing phosphotransfer) domain-containing protein